MDIISFFIPEFAAENLKPNKNQPKRSLILQYSFAQKTPHFTNLNSFEIENNILPKHSQKNFSFYKFSNKHVSVSRQKKTFALHYFLTPKNYFVESKYLYISVYLSNNFLFQRPKIYLGVWGVGEAE